MIKLRNNKTSGIILAAIVSFAATGSVVFAGSAHLTWNANSESDLAGYKIYYGTSSHSGTCPTGYTSSQDVGNVTSYWFDNLTPGQTYYFQLTAKDSSNNESVCASSGEVSKLVTYRSDLDNNHTVNIFDFNTFHSNYANKTCGNVADIDRDCNVGVLDYNILHSEYAQSF